MSDAQGLSGVGLTSMKQGGMAVARKPQLAVYAVIKDPATPLSRRIGIYLFFLGHMSVFGTLTFYLTYHEQVQDAYTVGAIAIILYILFFLMLFGVEEMLWLVVTSVFGLLMIYSWLEPLALSFIPDRATARDLMITDFAAFPGGRHVAPGAFLVMYEFLLRNLLIDVLGARHNPRRNRTVGWLFVAISSVQVLLADLGN